VNETHRAATSTRYLFSYKGNDLRIETVRGDPLFPLVRVMEDLSEKTIYFPGAIRPPGFEQLKEKAAVTEDASE